MTKNLNQKNGVACSPGGTGTGVEVRAAAPPMESVLLAVKQVLDAGS
jgi:hypothetical protein